jgi:FkbM family methyltransferase
VARRDSKAQLVALIDRAGLGAPARAIYARVSPLAKRVARDDSLTRALMAHQLRADANVVDIGAHDGAFLAEAYRCAPQGHHVAIEPIPDKAEALRVRFPDAEVHHLALSDETTTAQFTLYVNDPQQSGLKARDHMGDAEAMTFDIDVKPLDDVLAADRPVALIKIDVEGAEHQVLAGARRTIAAWQPTLVFEHGIGGIEYFGKGPGDLYDLVVTDYGYRIFDIEGDGPYTRTQFVDVFDKPLWMFVAHP